MGEARSASTILARVAAARSRIPPCINARLALSSLLSFSSSSLSPLMFRHAAAGAPALRRNPTPRRSPSACASWAWPAACSTSRPTPTTRTPRCSPTWPTARCCAPAYLSLTRGDGGQNLIGSEQGPALGLIRTQELLAARRIDGAEQFFTRARDFGYSKSPDETLRIWGKDAVLADVVRGHPPVSARRDHHPLFARAGATPTATTPPRRCWRWRRSTPPPIPTFHPEQLTDGVGAWQARRIFWNRSSFRIKPTDDLSRRT